MSEPEQTPEIELEIPEVTFVPPSSSAEEREKTLELIEPSPGFPTFCILIDDCIARRADTVVMDYTARGVAVRYQIDGLWRKMPPMDRQMGDFVLATMKQLAGMDYTERRRRQEGKFEAIAYGNKIKPKVVTQGVANGERVAIFTNRKKPPCETVEELGMRTRMREQVTKLFTAQTGIIVSCGMPSEGLTTSWRACLQAFDKFTRDFYVIEENSRAEPDVINVEPVRFDESKGEDFWTPIPQLMLKEPQVLCFSEITSGEMLNRLMDECEKNEMLLVIRIPAKHTLDALLRLMALKPNIDKMLEQIHAILCIRSIRQLCTKCKQAFSPSPQLMQKLGIPHGRIQYLHRHFPWNDQMADEEGELIPPCQSCMGIGFMEQKGLFELLTMTDTIRAAAKATPRLDVLAQVANQEKHITIRDEGIVMVAKGETSIEELQRVLGK